MRKQQGFTLIELLVAVAIIGLASALAVPVYADAIQNGRKAALQADGKVIHNALMRYYEDNSAFPSDADFDRETLSPLTDDGYLNRGDVITSKLIGEQIMIYLAPDIGGDDQQFILVMQLAADPEVMVGVVHTNVVTDNGDWVDGSYVIDAEDLEESGVGGDGGGEGDGGELPSEPKFDGEAVG